MKRFMKILSLGAAVLMLAGSLAACSGKPGAGLDLISEGKLVMGTNAFFPPFEYKEGGEVVGVDVDIVKAIAEKLDLTFEVKGDIEFDSLPESLKAKDIDLIARPALPPAPTGKRPWTSPTAITPLCRPSSSGRTVRIPLWPTSRTRA